jgi:hypothetical protein
VVLFSEVDNDLVSTAVFLRVLIIIGKPNNRLSIQYDHKYLYIWLIIVDPLYCLL